MQKFPYVFSRNRYKIDLIDVKNGNIFTLYNDTNTANMCQKLVVEAVDSGTDTQKIVIYFNSQ